MLVPVEASGRLWIAFTTVPGLYVGSGHPNSGAMLAWQGLHHWAISPDLLQYLLSQTYQKIKPSIQSFIVSFEFSMLKSMEVLWERSSSAGEREASHIDPFFPHPIVDLTFLVSKTPPEVSVRLSQWPISTLKVGSWWPCWCSVALGSLFWYGFWPMLYQMVWTGTGMYEVGFASSTEESNRLLPWPFGTLCPQWGESVWEPLRT